MKEKESDQVNERKKEYFLRVTEVDKVHLNYLCSTPDVPVTYHMIGKYIEINVIMERRERERMEETKRI